MKIIYILLILHFIIVSCNNCDKEVTNGDGIISEFSLANQNCLHGDKQFIIRDTIDLASQLHSYGIDCIIETEIKQSINFNDYSLIGFGASGGGCGYYVDRKIIRDDINKKIIYELKFETTGKVYKAKVFNNNIILTNKVPLDYSIEYKTK